MAQYVETVLLSFGPKRRTLYDGPLRIEVYPIDLSKRPTLRVLWLSGFITELAGAHVIHCHQYQHYITHLTILIGSILNRKIFVTDHGGIGSGMTEELPISKLVKRFLVVSQFSLRTLPKDVPFTVIYGGVVSQSIQSVSATEVQKDGVLFIGRLLPHKGIDNLILGLPEKVQLNICGRVYNQDYYDLLQRLSEGKQVKFFTTSSDEELWQAYQKSLVTVLPSVYVDTYGNQHIMPELLGLVLLESMSFGTPVICTNVGGMPEIVQEGVTGFIVPPNDPLAIGERINYLTQNPDVAKKMGEAGRQRVLSEFTWEAVAQRCMQAYQC